MHEAGGCGVGGTLFDPDTLRLPQFTTMHLDGDPMHPLRTARSAILPVSVPPTEANPSYVLSPIKLAVSVKMTDDLALLGVFCKRLPAMGPAAASTASRPGYGSD